MGVKVDSSPSPTVVLPAGPGQRRVISGRAVIPLAVAMLTLAALALRLYGIGSESLWLDEAYTLLFSRLPLDRVIAVGGAHEHPPLYYLIVHALLRIDNSPLMPRYVAAVAGTLSVPALYALGARLLCPAAGLVAAALFTVSPFQLWYGQDGRAYTLAGLFVLLSYLCIFTALSSKQRLPWAAYAIATTLALYTEYTTALALAPQLLLIVQARRESRLLRLLGAWALTTCLYLPWIGTLIANAGRVGSDYWVPPPTVGTLSHAALQILGFESSCPTSDPCIPVSASLDIVTGHPVLVTATCIGLLLAVLAVALWRGTLSLWVLVFWLALPFIMVLLISIWRPLFLSRIFLDALFPLYLLLGWAVTGRRIWRWAAAVAILALAAASLYNVRATYATSSNGDWRALMHALQAAYHPGQAVAYYPSVLQTLGRAYVPATWKPTRETPIWLHTYLDAAGLEDRWGNLDDNTLRPIQLRQATAGQRQLWIVTNWYVGQWELHNWLHAHGFVMVVHQWYGGSAWLELWNRGGPEAVGRTVLSDDGFGAGWSRQGQVRVRARQAQTQGWTQLRRRFALVPGRPYTVLYQFAGAGGAAPDLAAQFYSAAACSRPGGPKPASALLTVHPVPEEDFQQLFHGRWHSQPFGFVSPPSSACAVLQLRTWAGQGAWRHVSVVDEDQP